MKKVLFTAKVDSHILNFHIPYLKWFKDQGYEVHVASNGENDIPYADFKYNLKFDRNPLKPSNFKAYLELKKMIDDNNYEVIHCHTPIGGALTRLAARGARKKGTKVMYTAHGFHFYEGASKFNWLVYYNVEKFLSKYTDCLITINEEDFNAAKERNFKAKSLKFVKGVGINLNKFVPQTLEKKRALREEYGYKEDDFIMVYAAELSYRKHHDLLINAINLIKDKTPNLKLLCAGLGALEEEYKDLTNKLNVGDNIKFLGYRKDINNLMTLADVAVSSARQEGLPVNIMEAMATGLPIIVTDCRGNRDLIENGKNGIVVGIDDVEGFAKAIEKMYNDKEFREQVSNSNLESVTQYSLEDISKEMASIYNEVIEK